MNAVHMRWMPWIEALAIPLIALTLASLLHPQDPLFLHQPFPWLWLAPVLVALRYGIGPGLISLLVLIASLLRVPEPAQEWVPAFVGAAILTLICGEYAQTWAARSHRAEARGAVLEQRMGRLTDDLYVTRISHSRLEQNLIYKPASLRSALHQLKQDAIASSGDFTPDMGKSFLYLLNQFCGVQVAGLYYRAGRSAPLPIAALGDPGLLKENDPVYLSAMQQNENRTLADLTMSQHECYLATYLFDNRETARTIILAIEDISFFSLNKDNLQVIAVLFRYACGHLGALRKGLNILREWPDCPSEFAVELTIASELQQRHAVSAMLLVYTLNRNQHTSSLSSYLGTLCRGLDLMWEYPSEKHSRILFLLPFSGATSVDGHMARIEQEMTSRFNADWHAHCQSIRNYVIPDKEPASLLRTVLNDANTL